MAIRIRDSKGVPKGTGNKDPWILKKCQKRVAIRIRDLKFWILKKCHFGTRNVSKKVPKACGNKDPLKFRSFDFCSIFLDCFVFRFRFLVHFSWPWSLQKTGFLAKISIFLAEKNRFLLSNFLRNETWTENVDFYSDFLAWIIFIPSRDGGWNNGLPNSDVNPPPTKF